MEGDKVRPAEEKDLPVLLFITNEAILNSHVHFQERVDTLDDWKGRWREALGRFPWYVALDGDEVIGYARATGFKGR